MTAAFLLEGWRDARQGAALEQEFLRNLVVELQANEGSLEGVFEATGEQLVAIEAYLD